MQEWSDSVRIAIDVLVACVIITALLVCITIGRGIMRTMELQDAAAQDVQAYRVVAAYEGTDVYPQDVANLVLSQRGFPFVRVVYKDGSVDMWNKTLVELDDTHIYPAAQATDFTAAAVGSRFIGKNVFRCELLYYPTGEVAGYQFMEVS